MLAVKEFFKTDNVCFVYLDLKNKTEVKIELTNNLVDEYKKRLSQAISKINSSEFLAKNKDCNCEYQMICY